MTSATERAALVNLIGTAIEKGAGLIKACAEAGISRRTYWRWLDASTGEIFSDQRPTASRPPPSNALTPEERQAILDTCHQPRFVDLPPSQIVPILADEGCYLASESSFYRVLHSVDEQHERGRSRRRTTPIKTTHCATAPNRVWCWDVTWLASPQRGSFYYLYMIMDIWSRKIVGWEVHENETAELASELVSRAVLAERCDGTQLVLHADNGGPQKSSTLRATLERLGVTRSFSRPRVSDDNAYSESLFRTAKYRHNFPINGFESLEAARHWVLRFVRWYNDEHRHSGIRFVTPGERHKGRDGHILEQRHHVYATARDKHPERWSRGTRNWTPISAVWLNPDSDAMKLEALAA